MKGVISVLVIGLLQISTVFSTDQIIRAFLDATPIFPQVQVTPDNYPFPLPNGNIVRNQPYIKAKPFEGCSVNATGLKIGDHGSITSPLYPKDYTPDLDCLWFVESEPGTKIEATFFDFVTQPWFFVYHDYVDVSKDGSFTQVDKMAGDLNDQTPSTILSTANKLGIRFKTSPFTNYRGFKIQYIVLPADTSSFTEPIPYDGTCGMSYLLEPGYTPTSAPVTEAAASSTAATDDNSTEITFPDPEADKPGNSPDRIIGDHPAMPHAYPWMAALLINGRSFCGGSVIDEQHILTAAHCTESAENITILLGSHNLKAPKESEPSRMIVNITADNIFTHPDYDEDSLTHDISILRLPEKLTFSDKIRPICLPNRYQLSETYVPETVEVSGWGKSADNSKGINPTLQVTTVSVMSNENCRIVFRDIITGNQICINTTPESSPCKGDSGGPLFIRQKSPTGDYYLQLGVVSFGSFTCERGFPVGFTRTTAFLDYVELITGRKF